MAAELRPKKQISDRRRQQNKQAQRNYRERQKRTLKTLQDMVDPRNDLVFEPTANDSQTLEHEHGLGALSLTGLEGAFDATVPFSDMRTSFSTCGTDSLGGGTKLSRRNNFAHEHLEERGIISYLLQQIDKSTNEKLEGLIREENISVMDILKAGIEAVSDGISPDVLQSISRVDEGESSTKSPQLRTDKILIWQHGEALPDIRRNNIRVKQVLFTAACVANASALGISLELASCDDMESPFCRVSASHDIANTAYSSSFKELKEHLRPCASQLMYAHHPYIDVLPFPTLRERLIKFAYAESPMIDEDELCRDLENDGLVCWGSALGGGSTAAGSGAPWDIRSWEAQPWFVKKWWILIGGAEGEIYKQTQWWCEMRGDKSSYPW